MGNGIAPLKTTRGVFFEVTVEVLWEVETAIPQDCFICGGHRGLSKQNIRTK
jgi:hypothetical protein